MPGAHSGSSPRVVIMAKSRKVSTRSMGRARSTELVDCQRRCRRFIHRRQPVARAAAACCCCCCCALALRRWLPLRLVRNLTLQAAQERAGARVSPALPL